MLKTPIQGAQHDSDPGEKLHQALSSRGNRRRAPQAIAAAAGSLLLLEAATHRAARSRLRKTTKTLWSRSGPRARRGRPRQQRPRNAEDAEDAAEEAAGRGRSLAAAEAAEEGGAVVELQAESLEVRIVGDDAGDFVPGELTVDVGQSVTFVNVHSDEHTATGSGFDTGIIPDEGGTATVVLDTPGVFPMPVRSTRR